MARGFRSSFSSPLPDSLRRPLATVALFAISAAVAWGAHAAGWPREQVLIIGILTATVLLWMTEGLPLFATAFISIASQLLLLGNPGGWPWLGFEDGAGPAPGDFLNAAADPVLLLFFGGLVLARAVSTSRLDSRIGALVLRPMSATPSRLLLGVIATTACFSLLMSNTATTALMLALIAPALVQLEPSDGFRKALLLAVPISANIAGMSTPIASPPNAIAVSYLAREGAALGFQRWMLIAVPGVIVLLLLTWWRLLRLFPPPAREWRIEFPEARFTPRGAVVLVIAVVTFLCWITEPWHGVPAAVVAALPVTALFATGIITRDDVNTLDWDVLILIAGGLALGYSLQATGLDNRLAALVPAESGDLARVAVLAGATIGLGTFFSNTAIASMLMPVAMIAASYGSGGVDVAGYALTVALVASLSMALPVSTPPNAMAYARGSLTTGDFLRTAGFIGVVGAVLVSLMLVFVRPWLG